MDVMNPLKSSQSAVGNDAEIRQSLLISPIIHPMKFYTSLVTLVARFLKHQQLIDLADSIMLNMHGHTEVHSLDRFLKMC